MTIFVNDKAQEIPESTSLTQLAEILQLPTNGIALAVNNQVIPRTQWAETTLSDQAKIILIKAVCGG